MIFKKSHNFYTEILKQFPHKTNVNQKSKIPSENFAFILATKFASCVTFFLLWYHSQYLWDVFGNLDFFLKYLNLKVKCQGVIEYLSAKVVVCLSI